MVRLGLIDFPPELGDLLRYGRGVDTSRLAKTGFNCRYTSAGTVANFIRALRLRRSVGKPPASYTYEQDIEQFFRHSSAVIHVAGDG